MALGSVDWTGLGAFVTSIATLIGVIGALVRQRSQGHTIDRELAPKVDELHDRMVNGSSNLPADTPRKAPPPNGDPV